MTTEFTLQAIHAHVMPIQQTSLFGFWRSAIHVKILTHFFTLTIKTTNKMKEFMDYDINEITVRVEYYLEKGSEGSRDVPGTPDTLEVDSYHWNGMDVTQLVNAWASFEVRNIEEELLEKLSK